MLKDKTAISSMPIAPFANCVSEHCPEAFLPIEQWLKLLLYVCIVSISELCDRYPQDNATDACHVI